MIHRLALPSRAQQQLSSHHPTHRDNMRRKTCLALALLLTLGHSETLWAQSKGSIGIAMPTKSSQRWIADGENMVKAFTALGYQADLQYADDEIPVQLSQIENMVTKGVKALVIASIDGT